MGLVYSFNPLGGPVKISGSIIPTIQLPQDYALAQNANDFSGDPTTATALRSVDSMFYTVIHNEGGDTTQIEVLSLWSNGSLFWT